MSKQPEMGVCWYKPEDWQNLKENATDSEDIEDTHKAWLQQANEAIEHFKTQGMNIKKIPVDVAEMVTWCKQLNRPFDSHARSEYAIYKMSNIKVGRKRKLK